MTLFFLLAACRSYPAFDDALLALESDDEVVVVDDGDVVFTPRAAARSTGVVFYPGGLVEPEAYAAVLHTLAATGTTVVLVRMPSNLAVLAPGAALRVVEEVSGPEAWVVAGHSLGGAMAAQVVSDNPTSFAGVGLWAAYAPDGKDLRGHGLAVTSITATEDEVLAPEAYEAGRALLPTDTVFVSISGGNHAGFGSYGPQDGDGTATLPVEAQHQQTVDAMTALLDRIEG